MLGFYAIVALIVLAVFLIQRAYVKRKTGESFIEQYRFPDGIQERVKRQLPEITDEGYARVERGFRDYMQICRMAGGRMVAMPSKGVDALWHELILYTREYNDFCRRGLGRFLHHAPAESMASPQAAQDGLKRAWRLACARDGIDPAHPATIPLLFALDSQLGIPGGFNYHLGNPPGATAAGFDARNIGACGGCGSSGGGHGFGNEQAHHAGDGHGHGHHGPHESGVGHAHGHGHHGHGDMHGAQGCGGHGDTHGSHSCGGHAGGGDVGASGCSGGGGDGGGGSSCGGGGGGD